VIRSKVKQTEIVIDLTGPQGNAYVLLGYAKDYAKQLGLNFDTIMTEMMSSDYENLIQVFDHYFGDFVVLER
jgi:hypothetical protein